MSEEPNTTASGESPAESRPVSSARKRPAWLLPVSIAVAVFVLPAAFCGAALMVFSAGGIDDMSTGVGPAVAVIRIEGAIASSATTGGLVASGATSEVIIDQLYQANENPSVEAIVLRVNSPGGEVVASDEIHHVITLLDKPVVVSMGTLAASGGYYISAPADYIYATPHTFTGSIGVISQFYTAEELLDELGVEIVVVTSGEVKDFGSLHRDVTEEELEYWQAIIDEAYNGFVNVVADGRGLDPDDVREFADGRIITGLQAVEFGLVDEIGYFEDAVVMAAQLGGIDGEPRIVEYSYSPSFTEILLGYRVSADPYSTFTQALNDLSGPRLEYRYIGE